MSVLAMVEIRLRRSDVGQGHDFGTSFFGSMNGLLTTIALRDPAVVTTSSSVPSFERGVGTHAYPMFFFIRGDIASAVRIPISFPSFRTGHGFGSQGRTTSSPGTSTPTSLSFGPSFLIFFSDVRPMTSCFFSRSTSQPSPASYGLYSKLMSEG